MAKPLKRIAVTGGGGQIAYSLIFRIANGELLGNDQPFALHLLEVPAALDSLKGVVMELEDCAFPLLKEIKFGSDPNEMFGGVNYAFLVGAKPRGPGMERKDLLADNGKIFIDQGKALNKSAADDLLVLVVGNPCNTNCLIALKHAPRFDPRRFFAMTRLDQNRAQSLLARKANVDLSAVTKVTIWGNHSSTQVPDFLNAKIHGAPVLNAIKDRAWLEKDFIEQIQKRGATVIAARGKSSAASAAHAALGAMKSLIYPTPPNETFSCAMLSDGNPYGIKEGIVFSFPCVNQGNGKVSILPNLEWDDFLTNKIALTEKELLEEKALVSHLLA